MYMTKQTTKFTEEICFQMIFNCPCHVWLWIRKVKPSAWTFVFRTRDHYCTSSLKSSPFCWLILSCRFPPAHKQTHSAPHSWWNLRVMFAVWDQYRCRTPFQSAACFCPRSDWSRRWCCYDGEWPECWSHSWHLCASCLRDSSGRSPSTPPKNYPAQKEKTPLKVHVYPVEDRPTIY